ncbi:MAG: ATP-grasp domain-containing protein [Elusimicrobia bacterium]|nr:ATP-grasp domain-containing protein [Elusimicrobiota bacterium]
MNVLLLSPQFPPNFQRFSTALKEAGANVLGIGDSPYDSLDRGLKAALSEYFHLDNMSEYEGLFRATAFLTYKHGRIDRIDSHNEHWLGLEAQLRHDFNVFGQKPADLAFCRRKSGMKEVFRLAGVPAPPGEVAASAEQIRAFVKRHGFPVIFKPDVGVGAESVFRVDSEEQLAGTLAYPPKGCMVEKFIEGSLFSFDGLTDREGNIVFCASHRVSSGIMEIITERRPVHYYYTREIPPRVEDLGRKAVRAFRVRERFFHVEFLVGEGGDCAALEINVRPPGGCSLDMMNWACDIDLYQAWARSVVCGESHFDYERKYHVAHVGRRQSLRYRRSHEDVLRELSRLLVDHRPFPKLFSIAMGDYVYFLRHPDLETLRGAICFIEEQA